MRETPEDLARLQAVIERSAAAAGPAMRKNFTHPDWTMTAGEFVEFWGSGRMASIATLSARGTLHAAPLEASLVRGRLLVPTFGDAVRLKDHRANQRCVVTSWDGPYRAVIVYGDAEVGDEQAGMVNIEVTPVRIYAIRPPAGHPELVPSE